jgi:hypothetical protein
MQVLKFFPKDTPAMFIEKPLSADTVPEALTVAMRALVVLHRRDKVFERVADARVAVRGFNERGALDSFRLENKVWLVDCRHEQNTAVADRIL